MTFRNLTSKTATNWNLFVGLSIKRPAVVTPKLDSLQQEISKLLSQMEFEGSYLSAHEHQDAMDRARLEKALEQGQSASSDRDSALLTAKEKALQWQSEVDKFKMASDVTDNDSSDCHKTAWRCLHRPLFLLVRQAFGNETPTWCLPAVPYESGQTLRQVAQNLADAHLPIGAKCRLFGNAPSAVHVYKFRDPDSNLQHGVQMYFFNAYVDRLWHGEEQLTIPGVTDFAWITQDQLNRYIKHRQMLRVLKSFMIEY